MPKKPAKSVKKWSGKVTETSNAMNIPAHVFTLNDPKKIAGAMKRAAEKSKCKNALLFSLPCQH